MTRSLKRTLRLVSLVLSLTASITALPLPAYAATITVPDDRGRTLNLPALPQRIVSLLPSLTESICTLGACAKLVGIDRYANWPAEVLALPRLGGVEDAQIERIVALKPDVVLASPSNRVVDRLEGLGFKVLVLQTDTQADLRRTLTTLSALLGVPGRGEVVWAGVQKEMAEAARQVPPTLRGQRVYFEIDASPYAAGTSSFIGETLAQLGMGNVVPAAMGPFPRLNPEYVVKAQPDIVMAESRNLDQMMRRPGWQTLHALQNQRQCAFDGPARDVLVRPGPRLGDGARLIVACLQGLARGAPSSVATNRSPKDEAR